MRVVVRRQAGTRPSDKIDDVVACDKVSKRRTTIAQRSDELSAGSFSLAGPFVAFRDTGSNRPGSAIVIADSRRKLPTRSTRIHSDNGPSVNVLASKTGRALFASVAAGVTRIGVLSSDGSRRELASGTDIELDSLALARNGRIAYWNRGGVIESTPLD